MNQSFHIFIIIPHYLTLRQQREATVIHMVAPCLQRSGNQRASITIPFPFHYHSIRPSPSIIITRTPPSHRLLNSFPHRDITRSCHCCRSSSRQPSSITPSCHCSRPSLHNPSASASHHLVIMWRSIVLLEQHTGLRNHTRRPL